MSIRPFVTDAYYHRTSQRTKARFHTVLAETTRLRAPTRLVISGDSTVSEQIVMVDGTLALAFDTRAITISNHQIYADWCFLWFCAYLAKTHNAIFIVLKNTLKYIPLLGLGLVQWGFIFLSRDWKKDKKTLEKQLGQLKQDKDEPMWLVLFPEGTNYCPKELERSQQYRASRGNEAPMLTWVLLPRTRGLRKSIETLGDSITHLYDCTIAYSPMPASGFPSTAFTLRSLYVDGRPPGSVHMHWRKIPVTSIPIHDEKAFETWLYALWAEKDTMLCEFYETGRFSKAVVSHECEVGLDPSTADAERREMRVATRLAVGLLAAASAFGKFVKSAKTKSKQALGQH